MAIVASNLYAGRITTDDAGYPLGKAQDIINGEKGTGTPLRASWVNDQWGFLQALLDAANISPSGTPDQVGQSDYLDAVNKLIREPLALKIFQSPSEEGLTEIQTRTVDAGEVYEVRKTSDDSLATIYSDAAGTTEIVQDGTSNVSDSAGVVEFFVADGDYYVEVGGVREGFLVLNTADRIYRKNTTLNGVITLINGKIKPDNGITVTIGSDCVIIANGEWQDTSLGGTITVLAGAVEQRVVTKNTPTEQSTFNFGWPNNDISATAGASFVFGGTNSFPHFLGDDCSLCLIGSGYNNKIVANAIASGIYSGAHHIVHDGATHSTICGGSYQESFADYTFCGGGTLNKNASNYGFVGAGQSNENGDPTWDASMRLDARSAGILAGALNKTRAARAGVGTGQSNTAGGVNSWIGAGNGNVTSGDNSTVPAGTSCNASGNNSMAMGNSSSSQASASFAMGQSCAAVGAFSQAVGEFTRAEGVGSQASGQRSKAYLESQKAHASGYFAAQGDAQTSKVVARTLTSGAQTKTLDLLGGSSRPIALPDNTTWLFEIKLVARGDGGEHGAWIYKGCIKKDGTAASTVLQGAVIEEVINNITNTSRSITANTTLGSLNISVSSSVGVTSNIRWFAKVEFEEVGF